MALMKCPECGNEISDKAKKCPRCGYPIKTNSLNKRKKVIIGCVSFGIAVVVGLGIYSVVTIDSKEYKKAEEAYKTGDYSTASEIFKSLGEYKDSEERYLESDKKNKISNDTIPPVISGIPQKLNLKVGEEFDIESWLKEQEITAYDEVSGAVEIELGKYEFDINTPDTYEINVTAQDEAGNKSQETIQIEVDDYPTHEAYLQAVNISEENVTAKDNGTGDYEGIHISQEEMGRLEDGSVYRSIAKQLEGFWILGENFYGDWGDDIVPVIFGFEKKSTWDEMEPYIERAERLISRRPTLGYIMSMFNKSSSVDGNFDFVKGSFDFTINDLTQLSKELNITETMLGYILADLEEYAPTTEFTGNTYKCNLKFVGKRGCDKSDYTVYIEYENEKNELDAIKKRTADGGYEYYYLDKSGITIDAKDSIYGLSTNRGVQLSQSSDTVIFWHKGGKIKDFNKNKDIVYKAMKNVGDPNCVILDSCKKYIAYTIKDVGNIIYYFDEEDELIAIVYTDVMIY